MTALSIAPPKRTKNVICHSCKEPLGKYIVFLVGAHWVPTKRTVRRNSRTKTVGCYKPRGYRRACSSECYQKILGTRWYRRRKLELETMRAQDAASKSR